MKRSVNFSKTRKPRNAIHDIASFLQDIGITSEMLQDSRRIPKHDCAICFGDGYYYEDVIGDGGERERITCECVSEVTP